MRVEKILNPQRRRGVKEMRKGSKVAVEGGSERPIKEGGVGGN